MAKAIVVMGKICAGKSVYSNRLRQSLNAVIFSPDEATYELIENEQGTFYDLFSKRLIKYLNKKAAQTALAGANVIYERGLWTRAQRREIKDYFIKSGVECELHYVRVSDERWEENIKKRNRAVLEAPGPDFYVTEGLKQKLLSLWEEPEEGEVDIVIESGENG